MSRYFLILIFYAFVSCSTEKSKNEERIQSDDLVNNDHPKVVNIDFNGIWINEKYINTLLESKSAKKSQSVHELSFIDVTINEDSTCLWIWYFNEGTPDKYEKLFTNKIQFRNSSSITFINDSISIANYGDQTVKLKKFIPTIKDRKRVPGELIIKVLFSEDYTLIDSLVAEENIEFNLDGSISGFLNYNKFNIRYNYYDMGLNDDLIYLYSNDENMDRFIWQFNSDTLNLFKVNCADYDSLNNMCGKIEKGEIIYHLVKK